MTGANVRSMSTHEQMHTWLSRFKPLTMQARKLYGSPRLYVELHEQGISCSRKRVARLMREQGLCARRTRHHTQTTRQAAGARVAPNLLNRDFTASHPDEKWTG